MANLPKSEAVISCWNETKSDVFFIAGCAPPVGAYDPKELDAHGAAVAFDRSDRFKTPKGNNLKGYFGL